MDVAANIIANFANNPLFHFIKRFVVLALAAFTTKDASDQNKSVLRENEEKSAIQFRKKMKTAMVHVSNTHHKSFLTERTDGIYM